MWGTKRATSAGSQHDALLRPLYFFVVRHRREGAFVVDTITACHGAAASGASPSSWRRRAALLPQRRLLPPAAAHHQPPVSNRTCRQQQVDKLSGGRNVAVGAH